MTVRRDSSTPANHLARIAWRCRRGLKELDVLLERFLQSGLSDLSGEELQAIDRLLDQADPDVLDWLGGRAVPRDEELGKAVRTIRARLALGS